MDDYSKEIEKILLGEVGTERTSNINYPLVKFMFFLFFLTMSILLLLFRGNLDIDNANSLWLFFWLTILIRQLNIKDMKWPRSICYVFLGLFPFIFDIKKILLLIKIDVVSQYILSHIRYPDIILLLYCMGMVVAVKNIYFMDVLWLMKKIPQKYSQFSAWVFSAYFVIRRFIGSAVQDAWKTAAVKYKIAKNASQPAIKAFILTFAKRFLSGGIEISELTNTSYIERGLDEPLPKMPIKVRPTWEDWCAIVFLIFVSFMSCIVIFAK